MPTVKQPVPPELSKRGITGIEDNLQGRSVKLPAGALLSIFGEELRAHFARQRKHGSDAPPAAPGGL